MLSSAARSRSSRASGPTCPASSASSRALGRAGQPGLGPFDPDIGESGRAQDLVDVVRLAERQRAGRAGRLRFRRPEPLDRRPGAAARTRDSRRAAPSRQTPDGRRGRSAPARLRNAPTGSSKNITPKRETTQIMAAALEPVGLGVGANQPDVGVAGLQAAPAGQREQRLRDVDREHRAVGADARRRAAAWSCRCRSRRRSRIRRSGRPRAPSTARSAARAAGRAPPDS